MVKRKRNLGIGLGIFGIVLTIAVWLWPAPPWRKTPSLYSLRVQVVDPARAPIQGAVLRVSAGNEPHLLPDGWWEVQIPEAKVPRDRRVIVWAEHEKWTTASAVLPLAQDANPRLEIRLSRPQSVLHGSVYDKNGRGIAGVRVSVREYLVDPIETDRDGRFRFVLPAADRQKVTLHAEHRDHPPRDAFCYVGGSCEVALD